MGSSGRKSEESIRVDLGLYDQANKRIRRMPWQSEAMKDVAACEKLWGVGNER
jgi:hypothetical protein